MRRPSKLLPRWRRDEASPRALADTGYAVCVSCVTRMPVAELEWAEQVSNEPEEAGQEGRTASRPTFVVRQAKLLQKWFTY